MGEFFNLYLKAMDLKESDMVKGLPDDHVWSSQFKPVGVPKEVIKKFMSGKNVCDEYKEKLRKWTGMDDDEMDN
jgi:hypothetical protein